MTDLQDIDALIEKLRFDASARGLLGRLREGLVKRRLYFAEDSDGRTVFWVGEPGSHTVCVPRHAEPMRALVQAVRMGGRAVPVTHLTNGGKRQRQRIAEQLQSARNAVRRSSPELARELDAGIRMERTHAGYAIRFVSRASIQTDLLPTSSRLNTAK